VKYFFLIYAIVAALFVGMLPQRGDRFAEPPLRLFPDMDEQDKLKAQNPSDFFADGVGARHPVDGTAPVGFDSEGRNEIGGVPVYEFGGGERYYETGAIEGYYSNGMPEELGLDEANIDSFLRRGEEVYQINCMPCHGASGNGQGIATQFGVPGVANLTIEQFQKPTYPDGRLYHVIAYGKGNMGGYKHNIPLRDRWAVVAYVRALQLATAAPLDEATVRAAYESRDEPDGGVQ